MKTVLHISPKLEKKLKNGDREVEEFVEDLQHELSNLHRQNVKLEANNVSLKNRITVLEEELKKQNSSYLSSDDRLKEAAERAIDIGKKPE